MRFQECVLDEVAGNGGLDASGNPLDTAFKSATGVPSENWLFLLVL